ncbi:MAG TPA: hypothetical protein V6C58_07465 [Allocoleopsis sp.]
MGQSVPVLPEKQTSRYVKPGTSPNYIHNEDRAVKEGSGLKKKVISKALDVAPAVAALATAPLGNPFLTAATGLLAHTARKRFKEKKGYGLKDNVKTVVKKGLPIALDLAPSAIGLATTGATANPLIGLAANAGAKVAREGIRQLTGYGMKENAKKLGKVALSGVLDAVPTGVGLGTAYLTGNPYLGLATASGTKIAREALKAKTGLGMSKGKRGRGLKQKITNVAKEAIPVLLDSAPYIASMGVGLGTMNDTAALGTYAAAKGARELIRHKTGYGIKNKTIKKVVHHSNNSTNSHDQELYQGLIKHLNKHYKKHKIVGGFMDFDFEKFKKDLGPMVEQHLSQGLDYAIPAICQAISSYYLGNGDIGKRIGEFIRSLIKERTGYGLKRNAKHKRPYREGGGAKKLNPKLKRRNELVKKIMQEQGKSWIEASKYIAVNKIDY